MLLLKLCVTRRAPIRTLNKLFLQSFTPNRVAVPWQFVGATEFYELPAEILEKPRLRRPDSI